LSRRGSARRSGIALSEISVISESAAELHEDRSDDGTHGPAIIDDQYLDFPKIEFGGAHWAPFGSDELPRYFTGDFSAINASCESPQKTWKSCLRRAKYFVNEPTQNILLIRRFLI